MTKKEMTEIFSIMMLAWPNAEIFRGGMERLAPTVELWATCGTDVDFWMAQQAMIRLCRECKFPPGIAEFRSAIRDVQKELEASIFSDFLSIRNGEYLYGSLDDYCRVLPEDSRLKTVICAIGGSTGLVTGNRWNFVEFRAAYRTLVRERAALDTTKRLAIGGHEKESL